MKLQLNLNNLQIGASQDLITRMGTNGYSAYEIAVRQGYDGTEEEWLDSLTRPASEAAAAATAALQAASAAGEAARKANGAAAGITQTLAGKADLDPVSGTLLPAQADALLGRQTGTNTSAGFYKSTVLKDILTGSHTLIADFTTGTDITLAQNVLDANNANSGPRIYIANGQMNIYWGTGFSIAALGNTHYNITVTYEAAAKRVAIYIDGSLQHESTVSNFSVTGVFGIGSYSGVSGFFQGTFHSCRIFNQVLDSPEIRRLWNDGRPDLYMLPETRKGSGAGKCVAEYLPCGLLPDRWRDLSGNGYHLAASGTTAITCASTGLRYSASPFDGRQTGTATAQGYYTGSHSALLFDGARTTEILFTTGSDVTTPQVPAIWQCKTSNGTTTGIGITITNGSISLRYGGGTNNIPATPNTLYHYVFHKDRVQINGVSTPLSGNTELQTLKLWLGRNYINGSPYPFLGTLHTCRVFNYALTQDEALSLWNDGQPGACRLPAIRKGTGTDKCVAEYLPCGLNTGRWRDTSGNYCDLAANAAPAPDYAPLPSLGEVTVDTGLFTTDIRAGVASKSISMPKGYIPWFFRVINYNTSGELSDVVIDTPDTPGMLTIPAVPSSYPSSGNYSGALGACALLPAGINLSSGEALRVTATGNTTRHGMRVTVWCKYIGEKLL